MTQQTESRTLQAILIEHGLLTPDQADKALEEAKTRSESLRESLARTGIVSDRDVAICYAEYLNLPYIDLETYTIDPLVISTVDE